MTTDNQHADDVYLTYIETIDAAKVNILMTNISTILKTHCPKRLHILFSSGGGEVSTGIALYNFLRALPCEIRMYNIGMVASIATAIFMAAKKEHRVACPHTSFLFHGVKGAIPANTSIDLSITQELVSNFRRDQERIAEILTSNTSMKQEDVEKLFKQGEIRSLQEAVGDGIICAISEVKIPANSFHYHFVIPVNYGRHQ